MRAPLLAALLVASTALAGCLGGDDPPGITKDGPGCPKINGAETKGPMWLIDTSLGIIVVELCADMAPVTVAHFLNLTREGKHNTGASFYRVVGPSPQAPDGFVIQGGLQQAGQSLPRVPDEFNPLLRHDKAGAVSVAHAGPGTGSSEFFITLTATPHLDDRHAVFGYVLQGMDVVKRIGDVQVDQNDKPVTPVTIKETRWSRDLDEPAPVASLDAYAPLPQRLGAPGDPVGWAVVARNTGNFIDNVTVTMSGPEGWAVSVEEGRSIQAIPAGTGRVYIVSALAPAGTAAGVYDLVATAKSGRDGSVVATVPLKLEVGDVGEAVSRDWRYEVNYVGMTIDGRVFDTSVGAVATNASIPKFAVQNGFTLRSSYAPVNFSLAAGVIKGFADVAAKANVGETAVGRLAVQDAYATGDVYQRPLTGKPLVFEVQVLKKCATATAGQPC